MKKEIAVILPTYKRAEKLKKVLENYQKTSKRSNLYFVIHPEDKETKKFLDKNKQFYFVTKLEYTQSVNYAIKRTKEPFILCAADDVVFKRNWENKLLSMAYENPDKHIFGGIDMWDISKTLLHISHPFIRRSYIKTLPSGLLYWKEYIHYMNDIELIQRGLRDNVVMIIPEVIIEHPHPCVKKVPHDKWDKTYLRSEKVKKRDNDIYNRRCWEFWQYEHEYLHKGYCIPTRLNPLYNQTLLSIVIPSWNDIDFLKQVLLSIAENTYYRYEIIIIDDASDKYQKNKIPWELVKTEDFLKSIVLNDESCSLRVVRNKKHKWINYNWNLGARLAKGQYIAFLNSDITLSNGWDKFLIAGLEIPYCKTTISCPYERNPHIQEPFPLGSFFAKYYPNMIRGNCFMLRKADVYKLFPIPSQIKHWCGDNVLADRAEQLNGVHWSNNACIYHYLTQSGKRLPKNKYLKRVIADVLAYQRYSGKSMKPVLKEMRLS